MSFFSYPYFWFAVWLSRIQVANYFSLKALFHCLLSFQDHFWEIQYHFKSYSFVCGLSMWTLLVLCIPHMLKLGIGLFSFIVLSTVESFNSGKLFLNNFDNLLLCLLIWILNSMDSLSLLSLCYPYYFPSFCLFIISNRLTF